MKKAKQAVMAGLLSVGLMASGAMAAQVGLDFDNSGQIPYAGQRTLAYESLGSTYTVDLSTGTSTPNGKDVDGSIMYRPQYGVVSTDTFEFTLENATWASDNAMLVAFEEDQPYLNPLGPYDLDGTPKTVHVVATYFSGTPANGASKIILRGNSDGITVPESTKLYLVKGVPATYADRGLVSPAIKVKAGLGLTDKVSIKVIAKNFIGQPIPNHPEASGIIFDIAKQFDMTFTPGTSYIDYENGRKKFLLENDATGILGGTADTEELASSGLFNYIYNTDVEDSVPSSKISYFTLSLQTGAGFTAEDFANHRVFLDGNKIPTSTDTTIREFLWDGNPASPATFATNVNILGDASWSDDLFIGVNGGVLSVKDFYVTPFFEMASPTTFVTYRKPLCDSIALLADQWLISGSQFVVPNMQAVTLVITNESKLDAEVRIDVITDTAGTAENILIGTVPALTTAQFAPKPIRQAVMDELSGASFGNYWAKVTVSAPNDLVHASALRMRVTNGVTVFTSIPVLTADSKSEEGEGINHSWKQ